MSSPISAPSALSRSGIILSSCSSRSSIKTLHHVRRPSLFIVVSIPFASYLSPNKARVALNCRCAHSFIRLATWSGTDSGRRGR
jgi:hypothetical protein